MVAPGSPELVGKGVRDVYGRNLGRVVGVVWDLGGRPRSVGIEDGRAIIEINPDQIIFRGDDLVIIPDWKLETRHVGLERGGLMRRLSALSKMVEEKRITQDLAREVLSRLSTTQKSHEVVIARAVSRMEDLRRADGQIDDFVALVTLQHLAGEMGKKEYETMLTWCDKIKLFNEREVLDIQEALGTATGRETDSMLSIGIGGSEKPEARNTDAMAAQEMVTTSVSSAGYFKEPESRNRVAVTTSDSSTNPLFARYGPGMSELGEPPRKPAVEGPGAPGPDEPSVVASGEPAVSPIADQVAKVVGPESGPGEAAKESPGQFVLGSQVSEWVFAKVTDLEALDIKTEDFMPLKSLKRS